MKLINQSKVKLLLERIYKSKRLPTALLFYGISGTGKTIASLDFGKGILCENNILWGCGNCKSCKEFNKVSEKIISGNFEDISYYGESSSGKKIFLYLKGEHPDFIYLIPDGHVIKIDQIRGLKEFIYNKPLISTNKLVIIEKVDLLNPQAGNALLKILEEPPEDTFYILTAESTKNVLPTIISRTFPVEFSPLDYESFSEIVGKVEKDLYRKCRGSIRLFQKYKEKPHIEEMANKFLTGNYKEFWDIINKLEDMEEDEIIFFIELLEREVISHLSKDLDKFEKVINILGELKRDLSKGINVSISLAYIKSIIGGLS